MAQVGEAAARHDALVRAASEQRERLLRRTGDWWSGRTGRFQDDPRRPLDANLAALAALVEPTDTLVDVGGGAGRQTLPLALRCAHVTNADPSPGMLTAFRELADKAGITNASTVESGWMEAEGVKGDVVLAANVAYFVPEIVPFVEKLVAAARRRVIIDVWSVPPPNRDAGLFRVVYGEEQALAASFRELLPALWEMGILPDVQVLPMPFGRPVSFATRDEAVAFALQQVEGAPDEAEQRVVAAFDELFRATEEGFVPAWRQESREMLITWETGGGRRE